MRRTATIILSLFAVGILLYVSNIEYEMAREDAQTENSLRQDADLIRAADSLGLEGQVWYSFVNRDD